MIRKILAVVILAVLIFFVKAHFFRYAGNIVMPVTKLKVWHWEQSGEASGGLYVDDDAIRCEVIKTDGTGWHVQLYQLIKPLQEGKEYRVHFMAKSDANFIVNLSTASTDPNMHNIGLNTQVLVTPQWSSFDYTFTATKVGKLEVRVPYIMMGGQTGKIWLKDLIVEKA